MRARARAGGHCARANRVACREGSFTLRRARIVLANAASLRAAQRSPRVAVLSTTRAEHFYE
eukprot:67884-Pleurochrysis_carterae.AAC.1